MKWHRDGAAILPAWVADMDFPIAREVTAAMQNLISTDDLGYPDPALDEAVRQAFAARVARRYRLVVDPERVVVVSDVVQAIYLCLLAYTEPGDGVAFLTPAYPPFFSAVADTGRRALVCDLIAGPQRYELDLARLRSVVHEGNARMILLCNPHNPTGTVHTLDELRALARLARDHGVRVISDEIHAPLVFEGESFTPYLTVPGAEDAFTVTSASKAWNLAGLKAAIAVAGADAADDLARMPEEVGHGPSHVGIIAHEAAYRHGVAWLDSLLHGLEGNRALLSSLIPEHLPGVRWNPPQGTYLAWLDCRPLGLDDGDDVAAPGIVSDLAGPARFFLDRARVALSSGHVFGPGGQGHVRLNFGTAPHIITDALIRMGEAVRTR